MLAVMIISYIAAAILAVFLIWCMIEALYGGAWLCGFFAIIFITGAIVINVQAPQQYEYTVHTIESIVLNADNKFIIGKSGTELTYGAIRHFYWIKYTDSPIPQSINISDDSIVFTDDVEPSVKRGKKAWDSGEYTILYVPTNTEIRVY